MLPATSSHVMKMWSKRGGAKPTMLIGLGGGFTNGSRLPTICIPYTSSMTCPLGNVNRIASP